MRWRLKVLCACLFLLSCFCFLPIDSLRFFSLLRAKVGSSNPSGSSGLTSEAGAREAPVARWSGKLRTGARSSWWRRRWSRRWRLLAAERQRGVWRPSVLSRRCRGGCEVLMVASQVTFGLEPKGQGRLRRWPKVGWRASAIFSAEGAGWLRLLSCSFLFDPHGRHQLS